jgi:hypothetical protein
MKEPKVRIRSAKIECSNFGRLADCEECGDRSVTQAVSKYGGNGDPVVARIIQIKVDTISQYYSPKNRPSLGKHGGDSTSKHGCSGLKQIITRPRIVPPSGVAGTSSRTSPATRPTVRPGPNQSVWTLLPASERDAVTAAIVHVLTEVVDNERLNQNPTDSPETSGRGLPASVISPAGPPRQEPSYRCRLTSRRG